MPPPPPLTPPPADLEQRLAAALRTQTAGYLRAAQSLEGLSSGLARGDSLPEKCPQLQEILAQSCGESPELEQLRAQWNALDRPAGPELQREVAQQQTTLERLLRFLDQLQTDAAAQRERMIPRLDAAARARQMRDAYAAAERR